MKATVVLIVICLALASHPARASESFPQLRGIMALGEVWLALLIADSHAQPWCRAGDRIGGFVVESIEPDHVTLRAADGARQVVRLPAAQVRNTREPPAEPAAWARWASSRDNPMRAKPAEPPVDLLQWMALPEEQRRVVSHWYRDHGWQLDIETGAHGGIEVGFAPLHGDMQQAILAEKQHAFLQALAPEQRTLHTALLRDPAARQRFIDSLAPPQRTAFEQLRDPSVPLPRDLERAPRAN